MPFPSPLLPVMDNRERRGRDNQFWEYEKIAGAAAVKVSILPSTHPFTKYLPKGWMQGGRGTCFAGRNRVLMADLTYKPIQYVQAGEQVYTHEGRVRRVIEKMKRPWQGHTYKIKVVGVAEVLECTKEHPFLTPRGWVEAENLTTKDQVFFPSLSSEINDKTLNEFEKDPDFLWVLGLYLAEGSIDRGITSGSRVIFTLNSNKIEFAERVKEVMGKYGTTVTYQQKGENGLTVRLAAGYNGYWCDIFEDLGGEMCFGKRIHQRLMKLDPALQINIFDGWFAGDGYTRSRSGNTQRVGVTTSEQLVQQMWRILARNGVYGSIQKRCDQEGRLQSWNLEVIGETGNSYRRDIYEKGSYVRILSIEKNQHYFGEHVYNLEVEDDHSYIVEGVAVHNCVGHADAIFMQCNYYALTQDYPTDDEMKGAAADQQEQVGSCVLIYDKWYRSIFSAQWCYHISRLVGNVNYPSGSYCSAAAAAMKAVGAVGWDKCLTSKTPYCAPEVYPLSLDECKSLAADHILDGYAKVSTWSGIMDAIATSPAHCIMMPINVYDIPPDSNGNLRLGGNPSGSHALPWLFVDYQNNRIGCWNSWGTDYPQITWIDETYWREAGGPAFVSLDKTEAIFAKCLYTKTTVTANIPCSFLVNDDVRPEYVTTFTAMLEAGKEHSITAVPQDLTIERQTKTVKYINELDATVTFTFSTTPDNPVTPGDSWWQALLKKLLEMIRRKRSGDPSGRGN